MTEFNAKKEVTRQVESVFEDYRARALVLEILGGSEAEGETFEIEEAEKAERFIAATNLLGIDFTETDYDHETGVATCRLDCDAAESMQEYFDPLELTVLTDRDGEKTYARILFSYGGPNVWAERGPYDSHFKVCAAWGGEYAEQTDFDDLIADYWDEYISIEAAQISGDRS